MRGKENLLLSTVSFFLHGYIWCWDFPPLNLFSHVIAVRDNKENSLCKDPVAETSHFCTSSPRKV